MIYRSYQPRFKSLIWTIVHKKDGQTRLFGHTHTIPKTQTCEVEATVVTITLGFEHFNISVNNMEIQIMVLKYMFEPISVSPRQTDK